MDRREHLKMLMAGSAGAGLLWAAGCSREDREISEQIIAENGYGRSEAEQERDRRLKSENFFTEEEFRMVEVLSDIIIPEDEISGSATEAGVPDFIEFIMKDRPDLQVPTRGGLMWLNSLCQNTCGKSFVECSPSEQSGVIDKIAWPDEAKQEMAYGVRFFNRMRNLVATGFFTSQMGVEDIGYQGNSPNFWDGVPQEVLDNHGLSYNQKTLDETVREENRYQQIEWDENGNVIG